LAGGFVGSEFVGGAVLGVGVGDCGEGGDGRALAVGGEVACLELAGGFEAGEVGAGARGLGPGDELGEGEVEHAAALERGEVVEPGAEEGFVVVGVGEEGGRRGVARGVVYKAAPPHPTRLRRATFSGCIRVGVGKRGGGVVGEGRGESCRAHGAIFGTRRTRLNGKR